MLLDLAVTYLAVLPPAPVTVELAVVGCKAGGVSRCLAQLDWWRFVGPTVLQPAAPHLDYQSRPLGGGISGL